MVPAVLPLQGHLSIRSWGLVTQPDTGWRGDVAGVGMHK